MKVLFFTEGTAVSAASRIRVFEYLGRYLGEEPFYWRLVSFTSGSYCRRIVSGAPRGLLRRLLEKCYQGYAVFRLLASSRWADVVFIQRVLLPSALQSLLCRLNPRLVYDFDDAVYLLSGSRSRRFGSQVAKARVVLAVSEKAAGEALLRGARCTVKVVPSAVEVAAYRERDPSKRGKESFTVGWIGSPATTAFLEKIWPQLADFARPRPKVRFVFLGARAFDTGELESRTSFVPWSLAAEKELPAGFDVGLMPLADDDWGRGKGGYKLIQYMAAGVATLASPVGANLEIVVEGETGFFVPGEDGWGKALAVLYKEPGLCDSLGQAGRKRAETVYDFSVTAVSFFEALEEAAAV